MAALRDRVEAILRKGTKNHQWEGSLADPVQPIVEQLERGGSLATMRSLLDLARFLGDPYGRPSACEAMREIATASLAGETTEDLMQGVVATAADSANLMRDGLVDYLMDVLRLPIAIQPRVVDRILKMLIGNQGDARRTIEEALALGRYPTQIFINGLERSNAPIYRQIAAMCSAAKLASAFAGKRPRRDASQVMGGL